MIAELLSYAPLPCFAVWNTAAQAYASRVKRHRLLASLSTAQLSLNVAGLVLALRRRHAFDVPFMHGNPAHIGSQSIVFGTALSAPATLLIAQTLASIRLAQGPNQAATRLLQALGATYVGGYLAERRVRRCLTRSGWDRVESPLLAAALSLSIAMLCFTDRGDDGTPISSWVGSRA